MIADLQQSETWEQLPPELSHVRNAIENSRSLLALGDDWDEEGSPLIKKETWQLAAHVLYVHAKHMLSLGCIIDAPDLTPGPAGGIDLHWDTPAYEMLINVPADVAIEGGFYFDRGLISLKRGYQPHPIKGRLNTLSLFEEILKNWIKENKGEKNGSLISS